MKFDLSGVEYFDTPSRDDPDWRTNRYKKYVAVLKNGDRVGFGDKRYQHYKDIVPRSMGGGKWSHLNHLDKDRRKNFQSRHSGMKNADGKKSISIKYSAAWFSYYLLW